MLTITFSVLAMLASAGGSSADNFVFRYTGGGAAQSAPPGEIPSKLQLRVAAISDVIVGTDPDFMVDILPVVENAQGQIRYSIQPPLPAGLVLGVDGRIKGRPEGIVVDTLYTLTATDEFEGPLGTASASFRISPGNLGHPVAELPAEIQSSVGYLSDYYVDIASLSTLSGVDPQDIRWSIPDSGDGNGVVPGFSLDSHGTLMGRALATGTYAFIVRASAADGSTLDEKRYSVTVVEGNVGKFALNATTSCALSAQGSVRCWGKNEFGQLGTGSSATESLVPQDVPALQAGVVDLAGKNLHFCAVKEDGTVWCWGQNSSGKLGNDSTTASAVPVQALGLDDVRKVAVGSTNSCAIKNNGALWCWGAADGIGNNNGTKRVAVPVIGFESGTVDVAVGSSFTCASKADATVWCWGKNTNGRLGDGSDTDRPTPGRVTGLSNVVALSGGTAYMCAAKTDGTVWCWGENANGVLGNGKSGDGENSLVPSKVSGISDVYALSSGQSNVCAIKTDRTLWCWGSNGGGQIGDGSGSGIRTTPVQVANISNISSSSNGSTHTCAIEVGGAAWCWGTNISGQIGDGTTTRRLLPTAVGD